MKKLIFTIAILFAGLSYAYGQSLSATQTKAVFELVFGQGASSGLDISDEDKQRANLFLKELIEKSCAMSGAEALTTSYLFNSSLVGYVKELITGVYSNCYKGVREGRYYESIRRALALKMKSAFAIRKETGEW